MLTQVMSLRCRIGKDGALYVNGERMPVSGMSNADRRSSFGERSFRRDVFRKDYREVLGEDAPRGVGVGSEWDLEHEVELWVQWGRRHDASAGGHDSVDSEEEWEDTEEGGHWQKRVVFHPKLEEFLWPEIPDHFLRNPA